MRELPEPDIQPKEARDMGLEELPYFADKSILAIQKQAYEDGRRDAGKDAERYRWLRNTATINTPHIATSDGWKYYTTGADDVVDAAMLTASKKESQ